jgi:hypothetical protein
VACACSQGWTERRRRERRLSTPHVVPSLLSYEECERVMVEAEAHGVSHGWGSLHRRYPTVDLPLASAAAAPTTRAD